MIISLFYRIKNRIKKAKPATRAGYRGIRADRTGKEPFPLQLNLQLFTKPVKSKLMNYS